MYSWANSLSSPCMCMYVRVYVCMHVYMYVCMRVCMCLGPCNGTWYIAARILCCHPVCIYIRMHEGMYLYVCIWSSKTWVYFYTCTHKHTCIFIQAYKHTYREKGMQHTHTQTNTHTHFHTSILITKVGFSRTRMQTQTHSYQHTSMHAYSPPPR